MYKTVWVWKS